MNTIVSKARDYKYHSFEYVTPEKPILTIHKDNYLLIAEQEDSQVKIHWACESLEHLIEGINNLSSKLVGHKITLNFIPVEFIQGLENEGCQIKCEFIDFWIKDLQNTLLDIPTKESIRVLNKNETSIASDITRSCKGLSRGFNGENEASILEWLENDRNEIFVALENNQMVGLCMMGSYQNNQTTIAWLRELVVHPNHQRKGIGKALALTGLEWGKNKGATKSFLATDIENYPAITLYEALGFKPASNRGEVQMFKHL